MYTFSVRTEHSQTTCSFQVCSMNFCLRGFMSVFVGCRFLSLPSAISISKTSEFHVKLMEELTATILVFTD